MLKKSRRKTVKVNKNAFILRQLYKKLTFCAQKID